MLMPVIGGALGSVMGGGEFAPLIALGVLGGIVFAAGVVFALIDAVQGLRRTDRARSRLDVGRIVAAAVVVVFVVGVLAATLLNPGSEIAEAYLFALLAGVVGGLFVAATDLADTWLTQHARGDGAVAGA